MKRSLLVLLISLSFPNQINAETNRVSNINSNFFMLHNPIHSNPILSRLKKSNNANVQESWKEYDHLMYKMGYQYLERRDLWVKTNSLSIERTLLDEHDRLIREIAEKYPLFEK